MKQPAWTKALAASADPKRARHFLDLLAATSAEADLNEASREQIAVLITLFGGSQALSASLIAHPQWLSALDPETLKFPRRTEGLRGELTRRIKPHLALSDSGAALGQLREFKERELLRIGTRDLLRPGHAEEITSELSDLADVCLETVWQICLTQLVRQHGLPSHRDVKGVWHPTAACVIALGKLGGRELNYSSDVDIIFVYEEEGSVFRKGEGSAATIAPSGPSRRQSKETKSPGGPTIQKWVRPGAPGGVTLSNHQFFNRLAESFVTESTRLAPAGTLYRIDLRLRPEGDVGPLSRSLASYENYYAQWGQTWERMMLIKGRPVAGDAALGAEFLEMVQPFRYPRSINENVLREVSAMKRRIEGEVVRTGELDRNVKLGRGGIREIEFVTQVLQLLHAGRQPFLQGAQTLSSLQKLAQYQLLRDDDPRQLSDAYRFLRDVEHRIQMEHNRQTHTIPADKPSRERLARLLAFPTLKAFEADYQRRTRAVRRVFEKVLHAEVPEIGPHASLPREFTETSREWEEILRQHGFKDIPKSLRVAREFVEGPGYVHVSPRTKELALQLLSRLLALCRRESAAQSAGSKVQNSTAGPAGKLTGPGRMENRRRLSDPDRVLTRLDSFISGYGARGTLFELWNSNPTIFELLVLLFDRSEFLAELAIRTPDLVDELVTSGRLRQRKSADETLRDLRHGLKDTDQHRWLRRYHQAELMRIGLRDILGLADFEQYLTELSALADASLQYALDLALRKSRLKQSPLTIIGLGKLGGREIDYGSDLDIIFVALPGRKNLNQLARLAVQVMELLSARTADGVVFHTDARLRPDGEKGSLVNTLKAYEQYYRRRAQLWEIQALSRARAVAGHAALGETFQRLAAVLTNFRTPNLPIAAYVSDWKQKIHRMRLRIENERTPRGKDALALKTGKGGLMDAEFIAQILSLENGWREPNTLACLERARSAGILPDAVNLFDAYRSLRRVEGILRRWSYEGETVLPDAPEPYFRVSVRCGFETPQAFREAIAQWRQRLRQAYLNIIG